MTTQIDSDETQARVGFMQCPHSERPGANCVGIAVDEDNRLARFGASLDVSHGNSGRELYFTFTLSEVATGRGSHSGDGLRDCHPKGQWQRDSRRLKHTSQVYF